jgi:hypothetical protein
MTGTYPLITFENILYQNEIVLSKKGKLKKKIITMTLGDMMGRNPEPVVITLLGEELKGKNFAE